MNRKNFLTSVLGLGVLGAVRASKSAPAAQPAPAAVQPVPAQPLLIPPYLKPGDSIGITCPAGDITIKEIQPAVQLIESWGFRRSPAAP